MRRIAGLFALGIVLTVALWGSSAAVAGQTATVPAQVQRAIAHAYPGMAWIPGRLPSGFRFAHWTHSKKQDQLGYTLTFAGPSASQVYFEARRMQCPSSPSNPAMGTLHINGHTISWARTNTATSAWRCRKTQPTFVLFGANGQLRDDATLVAYARRAR